jgi:hypothetical protein
MRWLDLTFEQYRYRWQCHFGRNSRAPANMVRALGGQAYISKIRAMRRWLQQGAKSSPRECLQHFKGTRSSSVPERWLLDRSSKRLKRAIDRKECQKQIARRGLFDPLRLHQAHRGHLKVNAKINVSQKRRGVRF